jgi:hypothetical protein
MVMQATHLWRFDYRAACGWLHRAWLGTLQGQRTVRAPAMIIGQVTDRHSFEMMLAQHDHMIQALAVDAPNQPFPRWVLPRTPWCGDHFCDPQAMDALAKRRTIHVIPQQIAWRLTPWKGFDELLRGPRRRGVRRHVEGMTS